MTNSVDLQQPSCKDVDNSMQQQIATAGVVPSTDTASNDTCMLADNNGSSRQQSSNISNSRSQVANRITKSVENDPRVPNQETGSKSVSDHRRMCHTETSAINHGIHTLVILIMVINRPNHALNQTVYRKKVGASQYLRLRLNLTNWLMRCQRRYQIVIDPLQ